MPEACQSLMHISCGCRIHRERISEEARRRVLPLRDKSVVLTPSGNVKKTTAATRVNKDGTPDKRANNGGHENSKKPVTPWAATTPPTPSPDAAALQLLGQALADPAKLERLERDLVSSVCQDDLGEFCRRGWHVVEPATPLEWSWHHQLICNVMQAMFECWLKASSDTSYIPPIVNAILNVCPGSLKSRIVNVFFPAWCWLRAPHMKFICLSVNEDATMRDARASRLLINSQWYRDTFTPTWGLKGDQDAISNYGNTAGGERLSKPSGSEIVGLRCDCLLYDDPNAADESSDERAKINHIWESSIYTRVNHRRSMRIAIQQRVGEGDFTDFVVEKQGLWSPERLLGWLKVVLPAEFDPARRFTMPAALADALRGKLRPASMVVEDPRTESGQPVHPQRQSKADLEDERRRWAGTGHFEAQFNQEPDPKEGLSIQRGWFRFCRLARGVRPDVDDRLSAIPRPTGMDEIKNGETFVIDEKMHSPGNWDLDWIELSLDCALKKTERGSQWGILVVAGKQGRRFLLDDRTQRGDIMEILKILADLVRLWRPDKILVESAAAGDELMRRIRDAIAEGDKTFSGCIVEAIKTNNLGKAARLDTAKPAIANGLLHLLEESSWTPDFLKEVCGFPRAKNDDRVDAMSQVINQHIDDEGGGYNLPDW